MRGESIVRGYDAAPLVASKDEDRGTEPNFTRRLKMRKFSGVIAALAMAGLLAGWASGSSAAPGRSHAAAPSGTLTMAVATDPGNLDPQLTLLGAARTVNSFAYDPLLSVVGPGKLASGLAKSWKVLSAKKVQLTLRRGVTCADGTRMTASVVKRNIDFIANPNNKSPYFGIAVPATATTQANDRAGTVTVTTTIPNPFMLQGLGLVQIVCSRGLANRGLLARGTVGSGPYRLVEAVSGDHYTFAVRKNYFWGPNGATTATQNLPARVVLRVIPNETTAANLLLTGGINVATVAGADRARLDGRFFRRLAIGFPLEFFLNQKAGRPLATARVRRAVVQAMNLNQIGGVATSGRGLPMTQLTRQDVTPCAGNTVKGSVPAFNPSAARSVLSGASPSLRVIYPTDAGVSLAPAMELAQQQLSAAGVKVTLAGMTTVALQGALFGTGDWDIAVLGIGVTSPAQLKPFFSGPAPVTNFSSIDNSTYRTAIARATRRVGAAGCKYWLAAERALFRAANLAPSRAVTVALYGRKATFSVDAGGVVPTSMRLTK
jgi:peptide/nickel transport system substrate-binding protein